MTDQGLNIFDGQNEHFDYLFADKKAGALSCHNSVTTIAETKNNDVTVGRMGEGLIRSKTGKWSKIIPPLPLVHFRQILSLLFRYNMIRYSGQLHMTVELTVSTFDKSWLETMRSTKQIHLFRKI